MRWALLAMMALAFVLPHLAGPATADVGGDRTIWLYHTHTREEGRFTFRKDGRYDPKVLAQLDYFLRDWRNNKSTHMDPRLFDLLWTIYQKVGGTKPINIVSSYRSPATNAYLRRTTSGVAENSQHILGKAMDVFIPGVPLSRLRQVAMRQQVGGVGFYPESGSPFVHVDVGGVRAWPRMTTAQLRAIFPEGRTLHLPTNGVPLSKSGRQYAVAQWKQCHTVPCSNGVLTGGPIGMPTIAVASAAPPPDMAPIPVTRPVETVAMTAPVPEPRPDDLGEPARAVATATSPAVDAVETASLGRPATDAPQPATMSRRMMLAMRPDLPAVRDRQSAVMAIATLDAPAPASAPTARPDVTMTAYAPDANAQRALRTIIRSAGAGQPSGTETPTIVASALPRPALPSVYNGLLDMTWNAVDRTGQHHEVKAALQNVVSFKPISGLETRQGELVAPDLDHVAEVFSDPIPMTDGRYGVLFEPDEADFNPATELGPLVNKVYFNRDTGQGLSATRFSNIAPLQVASR
jgi:uncharacterized protein YcbK (DUF882 family)